MKEKCEIEFLLIGIIFIILIVYFVRTTTPIAFRTFQSFTVLCCRLMNNSFEELIAFQKALKEFVGSADPVYSKQHDEFFIGLEGR